MKSKKIYEIGDVEEGRFVDRPNRFIANIEVDGVVQTCHVHDSGRIKELLFDKNTVGVLRAKNIEKRKTLYDVVYAKSEVGDEKILINSSYHRYISQNLLNDFEISPLKNIDTLKAEVKNGDSRLDFLATKDEQKIWIEIKGVSLSQDGIAMFPDAPSTRAQKHLKELINLKKEGDRACVILLVFRNSEFFRPRFETDPKFSELFYEALVNGVEIYPIQFEIRDNSIYYIDKKIAILSKNEMDKNLNFVL